MNAKKPLLLLAVVSPSPIWLGADHSRDSGAQILAFSVAVKLSKMAESRLRALKETIVVIAYFDGDGKREPGIDTTPMRAVVLGSEERQVNANLIAEFKGSKVPSPVWRRLSDKNYFVTINTVSARKVVSDNILWCDDPIKRIETVRDKTLEVHCDLISEHRF